MINLLSAALVCGIHTSKATSGSISVTPSITVESIRPIALAASPSGSRIAASLENGEVRIIDAKTHHTIKELTTHLQPAYGIAWSKDGKYIATGDETARIYVEDATTGKIVKQYRTHSKGIEKLSFNATRQFLLSTGKDDFIKVYDLTTNKTKESRSIAGNGLNFYGATFNPTQPYLVVTGDLGQGGEVLDARSGKVSDTIVAPGNQGVYDIAFDPAGGRYVTAGRDGNAILWHSGRPKKLGSFIGHKDWIMDAAFSPNGKLVATSSTDGTVKVWNAYSFQKVADLSHQNAIGSPICFTADGSTLVTVNDAGWLEFNSVSPAQPSEAVLKPAARGKVKASSRRRRRRHRL